MTCSRKYYWLNLRNVENESSRLEAVSARVKKQKPKRLLRNNLRKNEEFRQTAIAVASEIWMILALLTGKRDAGHSDRLSDTSK